MIQDAFEATIGFFVAIAFLIAIAVVFVLTTCVLAYIMIIIVAFFHALITSGMSEALLVFTRIF